MYSYIYYDYNMYCACAMHVYRLPCTHCSCHVLLESTLYIQVKKSKVYCQICPTDSQGLPSVYLETMNLWKRGYESSLL